ncbi:class I SAM-dependent methyltransferase [Saccharopolyspora sp. CA-218241]|uniref:class I SAM-dependent methyltransferase n=1 Tax=Saccharopolyspora sp. CA-218241 TaxID=3240027 RepID=UPI003D95C602
MSSAPHAVVSYWNDRARNGYDGQPGQDPARDRWARRLEPLLLDTVGAGARVLDIGCGTGFLARILAAAGHAVTGQDVSPGMLEVAAERGQDEGLAVEWRVGEAGEPPAGPFDAVVTRNVLWTLPDPAQAVARWRRALRPGGLLLISDGLWGRAAIGDDAVEQRFSDSYAGAAAALPLSAGLDFGACAALADDAGFVDVADRTSLFDRAPYPSAPGFFLLTARAPR